MARRWTTVTPPEVDDAEAARLRQRRLRGYGLACDPPPAHGSVFEFRRAIDRGAKGEALEQLIDDLGLRGPIEAHLEMLQRTR